MLMGGLGPWAIEKSGKPFCESLQGGSLDLPEATRPQCPFAPSQPLTSTADAFAGGWCWIGNNYQQERLLLHYLWVFVIAGMNLVLYSAIALRIFLQRRQIGVASLSSQANVARVMLLYPIVYIICVLPLATYRIHTMRTATSWPIQVALGAGCVFTSSGLCNCIVYALTRRIVSLDSLRRRTTTTMVEREGAGGAEERGRTLAWERSPTGESSVVALNVLLSTDYLRAPFRLTTRHLPRTFARAFRKTTTRSGGGGHATDSHSEVRGSRRRVFERLGRTKD